MAIGEGGGGGTGIDPKQAEALAAAMKSAREASTSVTSAFDQQLKIILQMKDAMEAVTKSMAAMCKQDCAAMDAATWDKATRKVKENKTEMTAAQKAAEALGKAMKSKLTSGLIIATAALDGMVQGFKNFAALTKSVLGFFGSIASGAWSVGKAILAIPFKMMGKLFDMAGKGGGGSELAQAYENVREQFGSLKSESASTVIDVAKGMGKLDSSGVSAFRVFGNLAQRIEEVNKLAAGMGATFQVFQGEIKQNGEAIMRYQRGLGLTDEQMGSLASNAMRMGKGIADVQNEMTKQALGMSKAFGVNAKVVSKDMGKAMQDLAHFGHLSTKEMGLAAAFANKMGISVDKLTSMMDATKTFDQAAEGMGKLNEQYGTNIDATEVMMAQNPAEKFAIVAKGFKAAGKDLKNLSAQDRDFIKAQSGMTDEALNAMIANKDAGATFDKMSKQADKNEKQVLSQADAMKELADSIKRIVPSGGGGGSNSIMGRIMEGFTAGIQNTKEFRQLMMGLNRVLMLSFQFGYKLGKMFVEVFPGIKDILGGLTKLFDPGRFSALFGGIINSFNILKKGGPAAIGDFMNSIKKIFDQFLGAGGAGAGQLLDGFKKFGTAVIAIISQLGIWIVDELVKIIPKVTAFIPKLFDFLKDPKKAGVNLGGGAPAWAQPLIALFMEVKDKLVPALSDMFKVLWENVKPYIMKWGWEALKTGLLFVVAPAALKGLLGGVTSVLTNSLGKALMHSISGGSEVALAESGPFVAKLTSGLEGMYSSVGTFMQGAAGKLLGKAALVAAIATAAVDVGAAIDKYAGVLEKKGFDPATAKIAAGTTGLINTLTFGLIPESFQGKIAEGIASMSDSLTKVLDKWFGPGLAKSMKERLAAYFQIFGGLGNLISGLWNGDSAKTEKALKDIGEGILKAIIWGWEFLEIEVPKLIVQLGVYMFQGFYKMTGWLFNKVGDLFQALENIPIIGPLFGLMADLFHKLGDIQNKIADMFGWLQDILKKIDIAEFFKKAWTAMTTFFTSGSKEGGGFFSSIIGWFKDLVAIIEEPYKMLRKFFNIIFSWNSEKSFMENMKDKIVELEKAFNESADKIVKLVEKVFIEGPSNAWAWIKKNFSAEGFKTLFNSIVDSAGEVFSKILPAILAPFEGAIRKIKIFFGLQSANEATAPLADSFKGLGDKIKKVFDAVIDFVKPAWDAISALGTKIMEWGKQLFEWLTLPYRLAYAFVKTVIEAVWDVAIKPLFDKVVEWGPKVLDFLTWPYRMMWKAVKAAFDFLMDSVINPVVNKLMEWGPTILDVLTFPYRMMWKAAKVAFDFLMNKVISPVVDFIKYWGSAVLALIVAPFNFLKDIVSKVIEFIKSNWDTLTNIVLTPFRMIEAQVDVVWSTITGLVKNIKKIGEDLVKILTAPGTTAMDRLKAAGEYVWTVFSELPGKFVAWGAEVLGKLTKPFTDVIAEIRKIFNWENVKSVFVNLIDSIKESLGKLADVGPFKDLITVAKKIFKIASPSKVFEEIGDNITEGMDKSMSQIPKNAGKAFDKTVVEAKDMSKQMNSLAPQSAAAPNAVAQQAATPPPSGGATEASPASIEMATKIIKMITDLVTAISHAVGGKKPEGDINPATVSAITAAVPSIMQLVNGIKQEAGPLVKAMIDVVKSVPTDAKFKETLDVGLKLFEFLGKIPELSSKLSGAATSGGPAPVDAILGSVGNIKTFLGRLVSDYGKNPLQEIIVNLNEIGKTLTADTGKKTLDVATRLTSLLTSMNSLGEQAEKSKGLTGKIWALNEEAAGIAYQIKVLPEHIRPIMEAITSKDFSNLPIAAAQKSIKDFEAMVSLIQKIDDSLTKLPKINLSARMGEAAGKLGLGSSGVYTVQSKEVVINVSFTVTMDADKVERAIVYRSNSIIRDRINFALGNGNGENKPTPASLSSAGGHGLIARSVT